MSRGALASAVTLSLVTAAGCDTGGGGSGAAAAAHPGSLRTWAAAQPLEDDHTAEDNHPSVAMNTAGDGVVAWQRGNQLWTRRYDGATSTFGSPLLVTIPARYDDLDVGLDAAGNATLIWARDDADDVRGIWWSRSGDGGASWSPPAPLALGKLQRTRLAVSADGTALAAWTARSADDVVVSVGSCDLRGGSWNPVVNVPLPGSGLGDRNPRVALDDAGRGFLVWEQPAELNGKSRVWFERYDGGWVPGSVAVLDTYLADDSYTPTLVLNGKGAGMAIWLEMWNFAPQLWSRRFDGRTWGDPQQVAMAPLIEWDPPPRAAIDPAGDAVAVWSEVNSLSDDPQLYDVHAALSPAGAAAWQAPGPIETDNRIGADLTQYANPIVGLDGDGNAIASWRKQLASGEMQVYASALGARESSWTPADGVAVNDDPTHTALATTLAVSRNGAALAVWSYGPEFDIWASVYR